MKTFPEIASVAMAAAAAAFLSTSCVTPSPRSGGFSSGDGPEVLGVQYAAVVGGEGYETVEVFLVNAGPVPVTFTNAVLDGVALLGEKDRATRLAADRFRFDIGGKRVASPKPVGDNPVLWNQFYPDATLEPGASGVFQIGFRGKNARSGSRVLELAASEGSVLTARIPRLRGGRRITAVAWTEDGSAVTVRFSKGPAPVAVRIDGRTVPFRTLAPAVAGRPGAVVADLSEAVHNGDSVLLELEFPSGTVRAFLRAMPAFAIDAPDFNADDRQLPAARRKAFALDERRTFTRLPFDVACDDTRVGSPGSHALAVIAARLAAFRADPSRLHGLDFCTALYGPIWNIYGAMTDAVIVKPYQLHWGPDSARFLETEIAHVDRAVSAAAPKPVIWVPDRFGYQRRLEGRELELLAWCAALRGAKGIRHHFWLNRPGTPFADCPDIGETLPRLNRDLAKLRPLLSPLVPASAETDRHGMVSVLEGWSGDAGVLLLVRNMRHATDGEPNDGGRSPRFRTTPARNVSVSYRIPPWMKFVRAEDPLSGESYDAIRDGDRAKVVLPVLDAFRLVWIPNGSRE